MYNARQTGSPQMELAVHYAAARLATAIIVQMEDQFAQNALTILNQYQEEQAAKPAQ